MGGAPREFSAFSGGCAGGPRVGRSVNLFGSLPTNRTQTLTHNGTSELGKLMEGTTAGALIPETVRRGFQELLEA